MVERSSANSRKSNGWNPQVIRLTNRNQKTYIDDMNVTQKLRDTKKIMMEEKIMTKDTEKTAVERAEVEKLNTGYANTEGLALMKQIMTEDCQGLDFQLDRIKFAAGGTTILELPGDSEEPEMTKSLSCVILYNHPAYAYYMDRYQGGSNPPDCGSFDGVTGIGNPGGSCNSCPYNTYGSGEGKAKACKNRRMLYILREGEVFPMMLNLPTGSLKEFTNYMKRLLTKGRRINQVVTKISLRRVSSKSGIDFSQAQFCIERMLTGEERQVIEQMTVMVKDYAMKLGTVALVTEEDSLSENVIPETGEVVAPLN